MRFEIWTGDDREPTHLATGFVQPGVRLMDTERQRQREDMLALRPLFPDRGKIFRPHDPIAEAPITLPARRLDGSKPAFAG